jgi:hypothetical protein
MWAVLFFVNRVVYGTIFMVDLASCIDLSVFDGMHLFSLLTGILFILLQYYWFYKIFMGITKILFGDKSKASKKKE